MEKKLKELKASRRTLSKGKFVLRISEYACSVKNQSTRNKTCLGTQKHEIFTVEQNKKALSADDDKRHILDNGINTSAWGHYKINMGLYKPPVPIVEKPPLAEGDLLTDKVHDATFL